MRDSISVIDNNKWDTRYRNVDIVYEINWRFYTTRVMRVIDNKILHNVVSRFFFWMKTRQTGYHLLQFFNSYYRIIDIDQS